MLAFIRATIFKPRSILIVYIALAIGVAIQLISLGSHIFVMPKPGTYADDIMHKPELLKLFVGTHQTDYNNYLVFKHSWFHLLNGTNLYGVYPTEHWDFFKYSPTFALFMGLLAYLPDIVGLSLWNLLNVITLFLAIRMLPFSVKTQCILLWFIAFEMLTSIQNSQSNCLMCGLIILAYSCMQQQKILLATLWLVIATYIKVYGAIGFCLFLFYPGKLKFVLYAALWTIVLAALPLCVTSFGNLVQQYHNWADLLRADASAATGISVAGWLHTWFGFSNIKGYVTVAGLLLFLLPFLRFGSYRNEVFKLLMLAFMLIWMIIFNHKAESPTYIIAVAGVGIWYFTQPKAAWRTVLLWLVFIFTSLSATDIFPPYIRIHFIYPYTIKAVPCILVWCVVFMDLMRLKKEQKMVQDSI
ncbi:MAG: glycosyltransferase family 87 protein [Chitinophagales bacterium]